MTLPRPDVRSAKDPAETPLRVLHVNAVDVEGKRFNGRAAAAQLGTLGVETEHFVRAKQSSATDVHTIESATMRRLVKLAKSVEKRLSLQAMLYPTHWSILSSPAFAKADVLHLHILHLNFLSLLALRTFSRRKPVVWTLHDPWALTGHCVHPIECTRWQNGCGSCPHLDTDLTINRDTTAFLFRYKAWAYRRANFELIVASRWLEQMVAASPLLRDKPRHLAPFGVDTAKFSPGEQAAARRRFGFEPDDEVLMFREDGQAFKGMKNFRPALEALANRPRVKLLSVGRKDQLGPIGDRIPTLKLGWVDDDELLIDAYRAADLFVAPSIAETFGMMAVEAMSCGTPVVSVEGTALPEITGAPDVGAISPRDDPAALSAALTTLLDSPDERERRSAAARRRAVDRFGMEKHANNLARIYRGAHARWRACTDRA